MIIFPNSIAMVLFPAFSFSANNLKSARELFFRPFKYLLFSITPIFVIAFVFAREIMQLWLGEEFSRVSYPIFQLLVISFFIHAFAYIPVSAVQGWGRPDLKGKLDIVQLPIFVATCLWLIPKFGLMGAALSKLLRTLVDTLAVVFLSKYILRLSRQDFSSSGLTRAFLISAFFALGVFATRFFFKDIILYIAVLMPLFCIYVFLFFKFALDDKEYSYICSLFLRLSQK
jgi:O-antigen/teichoic acid export membrane protein